MKTKKDVLIVDTPWGECYLDVKAGNPFLVPRFFIDGKVNEIASKLFDQNARLYYIACARHVLPFVDEPSLTAGLESLERYHADPSRENQKSLRKTYRSLRSMMHEQNIACIYCRALRRVIAETLYHSNRFTNYATHGFVSVAFEHAYLSSGRNGTAGQDAETAEQEFQDKIYDERGEISDFVTERAIYERRFKAKLTRFNNRKGAVAQNAGAIPAVA